MRTNSLIPARALMPTLTLASLLFASGLAAQQTATGVVFEDTNANGTRDAGERGVAGVAVSNGRDVVVTDSEGRYEIEIDDDTIIFITKPANYAVPLDEHNLPQFYYIHKPAGSPAYYYPGVPPTGDLPDSVDFALIPQEPKTNFRAVFLADMQPQTEQELDYLRQTLFPELAGQNFAFGVNLGDIMFDNLEVFDPYKEILKAVGVPFYHTIGNHDLNFDAPDNSTKGETFQSHFGPLNFSWQEGDVHFVSFDNIYWRGRQEGRFATNLYDSTMIQEGLDWLANDLAQVDEDKLVVIGIHAPLYYHRGGRYVGNIEAFFDVIADRSRVVTIGGHTHTNYIHRFSSEDGWNHDGELIDINAVVASGSWFSGPSDYRGIPVSMQRDGTPAGYTILEFDGPDYLIHYKGTERPADEQIRIYAPGNHPNGDNPRRLILANVFYGTRDTVVEYRLNGGEWVEMTFAPQRDPLGTKFFSGPADTGKPWVNPLISHHIWEAQLGSNPPRGLNRWEVRATLPDGRVFTSVTLH